jgi:hypothetical protein
VIKRRNPLPNPSQHGLCKDLRCVGVHPVSVNVAMMFEEFIRTPRIRN